MAINGTDVVAQLRGRMKFYHVGDPVRRDMGSACEEIDDLRIREMLLQAALDEASKRLHSVDGAFMVDAASVGEWLGDQGVKLLPWQRKRLGLAPAPNKPQKAMNT
jgi:hypothetical protein